MFPQQQQVPVGSGFMLQRWLIGSGGVCSGSVVSEVPIHRPPPSLPWEWTHATGVAEQGHRGQFLFDLNFHATYWWFHSSVLRPVLPFRF